MTTVTVAIPTKDVAGSITETMHLLGQQTRTPDRVLIADSSTDDTAAVAREAARGYDYDLDVFTVDTPGVGAAREALRERTAPGLLLCLDAEVIIGRDWVENHIAAHEVRDTPAVVSGPWPGHDVTEPTVVRDTKAPHYFIEANCSMHTATADRIGGWDSRFERGCDWDFRLRLRQKDGVVAVCDPAVGARPMATNSGGWLHIKKQFDRPSSVPYLRKYGAGYALFYPLHPLGDVAGVLALGLVVAAPLMPHVSLPLLTALGLLYAGIQARPGDSGVDWALRMLGLFPVGWSTLRAVRSA